MFRFFRIKISLLSLCISGLMLLAFGFFAVSSLNRVGIERIDRELRALADTQVRKEKHRNHWARFSESFRDMYGMDESKQFVVKATHADEILHPIVDWPDGLPQDALPLQTQAVPPQSSLQQDFYWDETRPQRMDSDGNPMNPPRRMTVCEPAYATLQGAGESWRAITMANEEVTLSIAINLKGLRTEISHFRNTLLIAVPLGLLLLAAGGWIIGHLALRPVDRIARTAKDMTAHRLNARISTEKADGEFRQLIDVINGMLERLDQSFHQATRFSADAAHELKTPLAILQAQLERSLQRAADASPEQLEYAEQLDEVQRLKVILQKLFLLSLTDAGQLPLNSTAINLVELARSAAADIEILAPDRTLTIDAPAELSADGDAHLINQILENLISNAVKFGAANGWIKISVADQHGTAVITVANSGTPIPKEDQDKIFERFYRGDPARSRQTEGTGLGLSLAREIAKAHGGKLSLQQSNETLTCFMLQLPRSKRS